MAKARYIKIASSLILATLIVWLAKTPELIAAAVSVFVAINGILEEPPQKSKKKGRGKNTRK